MNSYPTGLFPSRRVPRGAGIGGLALIPFLAVFLALVADARADWPDYRGPGADGHVSTPGDTNLIGLPLRWSETENLKWKTPIHDRGWSTPVIMGNQVWLTTATEDGHDFFAICVDADTGKIVFDKLLFHADNPEPLGNNVNAYATPSPVIEPGRVYIHFGSYGTACLDTATDKILWQRTDLRCRHYRGPSSSPIIYQDLLILTFDGIDRQYVTGLNKNTGETVWTTDRSAVWNDEDSPGSAPGDKRKGHSTPLIITNAGKAQMLSAGAKEFYSYDPLTGKEIWKIAQPDYSPAPRPMFWHGLAYMVTGQTKAELWALPTDKQGELAATDVVWKLKAKVGKTASPILVDGLIYTVSDESFVTCLDAGTGVPVWTERIGGSYASSPIYGDGHIYFFDKTGATTVLKPGRTCDVVATNKLANGFMSCPAASGKAFYLRTKTDLYRVEATAPATKPASE